VFFGTKECVASVCGLLHQMKSMKKNIKFQKDIESTSLQLIGWYCVYYLYIH